MWAYVKTVRVECEWGQWSALVTLARDGVEESFFVRFEREPTVEEADAAGTRLARQKSVADAPFGTLPDPVPAVNTMVLTREDFFGRFTNAEIAAIYRAAQSNDDLFAYVKKLEINPTIRRNAADVAGGLNLLEAVGLIGPGRAAMILG